MLGKKTGAFLVFLGAFFWSLNAPLIKLTSTDSFLTCGLRALIAGIALLPFLRPKKIVFSKWTVIYFVSFASLCTTLVVSLSMTSATISVGMQYTAILWIFIASSIKNRQIDKKILVPVCFIAVGVILFMASGLESAQSALGNLLALTEGISFAVMTYSCQKAVGDNPIGMASLANLFTGMVVFLLFPDSLKLVWDLDARNIILLLILGIVQVAMGYACYNIGIKYVSSQKASMIALWEMILGPAWVAIFLKEYPSPMVLCGFLFILTGMVIDSLPKRQQNSASNSLGSLGEGL